MVFGILIAFASLSGAMAHVVKAMNTIYEVEEARSFIMRRLISVCFIVAAIIAVVAMPGLLLLNESFLQSLGVPVWLTWTILIARWVVIAGIMTVGLAAFYRYAPNRENPHWQWVTCYHNSNGTNFWRTTA